MSTKELIAAIHKRYLALRVREPEKEDKLFGDFLAAELDTCSVIRNDVAVNKRSIKDATARHSLVIKTLDRDVERLQERCPHYLLDEPYMLMEQGSSPRSFAQCKTCQKHVEGPFPC